MSTDGYREEYEAQLSGRAALRAGEASKRRTAIVAHGKGAPDEVTERIHGIEQTTIEQQAPGLTIPQVIASLADDNEPPDVRQAALAKLEELEFHGAALDPYRPDYLEALKKAAKAKVGDLVQAALEVLAVQKEPFARDSLLAFLKDPNSAAIPIAKVIQLLSYDDHGDVVSNVRSLLEKTKDPVIIEEAVRLLSSDAGSESLFSRLLNDKSQPGEVRKLSANGLHNVNPALFATIASKIVDDDGEDDDLRATCLSTLTHFSDYAKERLDTALAGKVQELVNRTPSINLKATASRFLERLKQERK